MTLSAFAAPANEAEGSQAEELRLNKAATPSDAEKPDETEQPEKPDTDKPDTDETENTDENGGKEETGNTAGTPEKPENTEEPENATSSEAAKPNARRVQKLIDALPEAEEVTEDNLDEVKEQLAAIEEAMAELDEDEYAKLDLAQYNAVLEAVETVESGLLMKTSAKAVQYRGPELVLGADQLQNGANVRFGRVVSSQDYWSISWRVLANEGDQLLLFSEESMGMSAFNKTLDAQWVGSRVRSMLTLMFYGTDGQGTNSMFDEADRNAVIPSLTEEANGDHIFLLSVDEAKSSDYFPLANHDRKPRSNDLQNADKDWWLRTPGTTQSGNVAYVDKEGAVNVTGKPSTEQAGVRPAVRVMTDHILYTSAESKDVSAPSSHLVKVKEETVSKWRLTLKDDAVDFQANADWAGSEVKAGQTLSIDYTASVPSSYAAQTQAVSAILTNSSGDAIYSGQLAAYRSGSDKVSFTVPADLEAGDYVLRVFYERSPVDEIMSDLNTYASDFSEIPFSVGEDTDTSELAAPTNVKWDASLDGTATWDAVKGATGYEVELYFIKNGKEVYEESTTVDGGDTTQTMLYITRHTDYFFKVTAYNDTERSSAAKSNTIHFDHTNVEGFNIEFISDSGGSFIASVEYGQPLLEPNAKDNPKKEGYTFLGWYLENGEKYDFSKPVFEEFELYAKWEKTPDQALTAPSNAKWDASLDGTATWDAVDGATGYEVQLYIRYDGPGPSSGKIGDAVSVSGKDNTSCKLIYDMPGDYFFTVKAVNESGSSSEAKSGETHFNIANAEFVTITFTDAFINGNVLFTKEVKPGELLTEPEAPSKPGYRFNGWWDTPDRKFDFTKPVTGSATIYADWIAESADLPRPNRYYWKQEVGRVTWDKVEGAAGYGLQLFGTNDGGKTKWRIGDEVTVGADKTEYTFPIDNIYLSYLVNIWAVDQEGRKGQIGEGITPHSYDKVNVDYVTVTIDTLGGTEVAPVKVKVGDKISFPKAEKDGYMLQGWTYDTGERWSFNDPVMSSMTLKAIWAKDNIPYPDGLTWDLKNIGRVTWDSTPGAAGYQIQLYGDKLEDRYAIGEPIQLKGANNTSYRFAIDSIYHSYSFGVRVMDQNGNLGPETLTGAAIFYRVNVSTVDVRWDANGGRPSPLATLKIGVGTRITDVVEPHQPVKDGYTLMGWVNKETGKVWNMNDPVVSAMTLVAVWGKAAVDNNTTLTSFYIGNTKGVISGKTITVKLPRGSKIPTEPTTFRATFANTTNNVVIADMETKNGGKTWTFKVQTKDGKYATNYTLYVSVQSSTSGGGGGGSSSGGGGGGGGGGSSSGSSSFSGSGVNTFGGPGAVSQTLAPNGNWESDANGWKFKTTAGAYPTDNWYECVWNNAKNWYHFDANGYLNSGWFTDKDGQTYYLHDVHDNGFGYMYTGWHWIGGKCYYFNPVSGTNGLMKGVLFKNTTTPDGYTVDATGAWTVNGVVQTQQ